VVIYGIEVTKEEEERINLVNKVVKNCQQDEIYLRDIIHEYFQFLEDTTLGLKGIKETLQEREEYKSKSGCELEDVTDEFYDEKGELKQ
tara:strand:+ start:123 stop:389 length:267 start_codon:yes stop_codon:yes gene_type:complete